MADSYVLEKIGRRFRDASRDVVEQQLPEQLSTLIGRLAKLERPQNPYALKDGERHQPRSREGWRKDKRCVCL